MPYTFNPFTGTFDDTVPLTNGQISSDLLPSYVDDVLEYADLASFPVTGETGKIYVAIDVGATYRWSGSAYVAIGSTINNIDDLADVDTSTVAPTDGQVLTWDNTASKWEPATPSASIASIDDIGDVTSSSPSLGQSLVYNGNQWVNGPLLGGVASYTNAAAVMPLDGNANPAAGTLVSSGFTLASNISSSTQWSTSTVKIGTGAAYLPNVTPPPGIVYENSALRSFLASNDFTVELWFQGVNNVSNVLLLKFGNYQNTSHYFDLRSNYQIPYNRLNIYSGGVKFGTTASTDPVHGNWTHIAITHANATKQVKLFVGGIYIGATTLSSTLSSDNMTMHVGCAYSSTYNTYYTSYPGYYDNIVITPGLKYTSNFTPVAVAEGAFIDYDYIQKSTLQTEIAAATDFADFQSRIAAL